MSPPPPAVCLFVRPYGSVAAPPAPSLSSLRNRQPQQSETRAAQPSSGYRSDYDQYSQYHQQQMYPGYYSSWGYDQTGYAYNGQLYDYSQYPAAQVSPPPPRSPRLTPSI